MREPKFRVWSNYWKKYATEAELHMDGSVDVIFEDDDGVPHHDNTDLVVEFNTGLKDSNSKEIYNGDIVENTYRDIGKVRYEVGWDCGRFVMESKKPYNLVQIGMGIYPNSSKVIGNIHENHELLEEE